MMTSVLYQEIYVGSYKYGFSVCSFESEIASINAVVMSCTVYITLVVPPGSSRFCQLHRVLLP